MYIKTEVKKTSLWRGIYALLIGLNILAKVIVSSNMMSAFGMNPTAFEYYVLRGTLFGLILLFIFEKKHSKSKVGLLAIMFICVVYTYINASTLSFAMLFLLIASYPEKMNINKLARVIFGVLAISILSIVTMCILGIIENVQMQRVNDIVMRNSMGFSSANALANMVLYCLLAFVIYKEKQWNIWHSMVWILVIGMTYFTTDGRMSCGIALAVVMIESIWLIKPYIIGKKNTAQNVIFFFEKIAFVLFLGVCYILTRLYAEGKFHQYLSALDILSTYRLSFMVKYYKDPGISLFGQLIKTVTAAQAMATGSQWSGLDNSYIYMLIVWGIVGTIIYSFLSIYLGKYHEMRQNKYAALCVIAICIISISEAAMFNVTSNMMLIMFADMVSNYRIVKEN